MLKSMTGYGEGSLNSDFGMIRIELKSINHRFLDNKINLPRALSFVEPELKEEIRKKIKRGVVFLNLYWDKSGSELGELKLNNDLVESLKKNLGKLQKHLEDSSGSNLDLIANFPGVFYFAVSPRQLEKMKLVICKVLKQALDHLVKSRTLEGQRIEKDIKHRLGIIDKELIKIETYLPRYREKIKRQFEKKLQQICNEEPIDRERLNKEVYFNLIRSDFTEEMVRINSHLKTLEKLISRETSGKNIEFLLQEINREINTLNDKASDIDISNSAIVVKVELEKLREQALNLE